MRYITLHCAATPARMDVGVSEIRQWHLERGFRDVGYHYIIRRNGDVETGRPENVTGAHTGGYNTGNLGVCIVGGVADDGKTPQDNYTDAQWDALHTLMIELHERYPEAQIMGHNGFPGHESRGCPCFDWREWRDQFLTDLLEEPIQLPSHWLEEVDTAR